MKANDTQVAGSHYKTGDLQHWDLSRIFKWDPMQYQIIKYVMRWKDKHDTPEKRLEDLKKARHFLDKYIEDYADYDDHKKMLTIETITEDSGCNPTANRLHSNDPGFVETDPDWQCEGWYGDRTQLYRCRHCRSLFRAKDVARAEEGHGSCPRAQGYVNQG